MELLRYWIHLSLQCDAASCLNSKEWFSDRSLATRGELVPIYQKAKEKAAEAEKRKKEKGKAWAFLLQINRLTWDNLTSQNGTHTGSALKLHMGNCFNSIIYSLVGFFWKRDGFIWIHHCWELICPSCQRRLPQCKHFFQKPWLDEN